MLGRASKSSLYNLTLGSGGILGKELTFQGPCKVSQVWQYRQIPKPLIPQSATILLADQGDPEPSKDDTVVTSRLRRIILRYPYSLLLGLPIDGTILEFPVKKLKNLSDEIFPWYMPKGLIIFIQRYLINHVHCFSIYNGMKLKQPP